MKLTKCLRQAVSVAIFSAGILRAGACGPYSPIVPTPDFFKLSGNSEIASADYDREENLREWQKLTSDRIPLSDIEEAVYRWSGAMIFDKFFDRKPSGENLFLVYLRNTDDYEAIHFLTTAKELEERWRDMRNPWYYPESRENWREKADFDDILEECEDFLGERFRDRYAYQAVRLMFASRQYSKCIEYYDSLFASIPDDNLMKRMGKKYVAGCWSRLGDKERADSVFAAAGDVLSITPGKRLDYMFELNPDAPQLMTYIRINASDSAGMMRVVPRTEKMLRDRTVKNRGDWETLLAYYYNEIEGNPSKAREHILRALPGSFSTDELHDVARAYKMKLDGRTGHMASLVGDLKWMDTKVDRLSPDAEEWRRRVANIIYVDFVPGLWKRGDRSTAILLAAYADNIMYHEDHVPDTRWSEDEFNRCDYRGLSFEIMCSLPSGDLAGIYEKIRERNPLYDHLRTKARADSDYYYDVIGTLAIREENFGRAAEYLARVSPRYQRTMNVFKQEWLSRDPFSIHPRVSPGIDQMNAKLNFARKMAGYKNAMVNGATGDERGMARLMYAIGRYNSLMDCWALTDYYNGWYVGRFEPIINYYYYTGDFETDPVKDNYAFLRDFQDEVEEMDCYGLRDKEIKAALAMMDTDESRARAEYMLGNLRTVVVRYGNTLTGWYVKSSCDNWRNWF